MSVHAHSKLEPMLAACTNCEQSSKTKPTSLGKINGFWEMKSNVVPLGQHVVACDPPSGTLQVFLQDNRCTHILANSSMVWLDCGDLPVQSLEDPDASPPVFCGKGFVGDMDWLTADLDESSDFLNWFLYTSGDQLVLICRLGDVKKVFSGSLRSKYSIYLVKSSHPIYLNHAESLYIENNLFSLNALHRLEVAGFPVITSPDNARLAEIIGVSEEYVVTRLIRQTKRKYQLFKIIISLWLSGESSMPPTWRSLYQVLEELGLLELSQRIQEYLIDECTI